MSHRHSSPSILKTSATALLLFTVVAFVGCRVERAPSRIEKAEDHQARLADVQLPILPQPDVNDAARVIATCGEPYSDRVAPIYSKYYNGPVRSLEYVVQFRGQHHVKLDFIPTRPRAQLAYTEAPLPHGDDHYAAMPADATWRFQAGQVEEEYIITSHRLGVYLPCAADVLKYEF